MHFSRVLFVGLLVACAEQGSVDPNALLLSQVSAGNAFSCGLATDSTAVCWGANQYGQLGSDSSTDSCKLDPVATGMCSARPVPVSGGLKFSQLDAGEGHVCALTREGHAYCWGENASGQLGNLTVGTTCTVAYYAERGYGTATLCSRAPVAVETDLRFTSISAASGFTCGLTRDGVAYCWGAWTNGRFGGALDSIPNGRFARFEAGEPFTQISADGGRVCALGASGRAFCWGGNGAAAPKPVATDVRFLSVSRGWRHACGIARDSTAHCWGDNYSGQLGNGEVNPGFRNQDSDVYRVVGNVRYSNINAGFLSTCAVAVDGAQYCWGAGSVVGVPVPDRCTHVDVTAPCALRPIRTSLRNVAAMTSGFSHRCALLTTGASYCWGYNQARAVARADSQKVFPARLIHR